MYGRRWPSAEKHGLLCARATEIKIKLLNYLYMDNKYTFYNQDLAMRGRLMDVCVNFMICCDRVTETLPEDVKQSIRTECSDLMQRLSDIADDVWPIVVKGKRKSTRK